MSEYAVKVLANPWSDFIITASGLSDFYPAIIFSHRHLLSVTAHLPLPTTTHDALPYFALLSLTQDQSQRLINTQSCLYQETNQDAWRPYVDPSTYCLPSLGALSSPLLGHILNNFIPLSLVDEVLSCCTRSALANTSLDTAPNALSDLRSKLKGLFKSKKSAKPADKPAEPAAATATESEAPTATKDAAEPTPAPAGGSPCAMAICPYILLTCICS